MLCTPSASFFGIQVPHFCKVLPAYFPPAAIGHCAATSVGFIVSAFEMDRGVANILWRFFTCDVRPTTASHQALKF